MTLPIEAQVNALANSVANLWARVNNISTAGGKVVIVSGGVGGATPVNDADYLVGTANAGLSAEIVVGTTPGGELGGTWPSPTVDATHSGSAHHSAVTLGTDADVLLGLTGQQIDLDTQSANRVFAGPVSGGAADPTFRALVAADLPTPEDSSTTATVSTTDATVTTLATIAAAATTTMLIEAKVIARRTGGVLGTAEDGAAYDLLAAVKNVAGTATLIGAVLAVSTMEDQVLWDATIDVSGGNARIRVTGAAQNNVDWKAEYKTVSVT